MKVLAIYVGRVGSLQWQGRPVPSGFVKSPARGPVKLSVDGLDGDEQGDPRHHGGPDKAVCVYPGEHYPHVEAAFGGRFGPAGFGENFTTEGLVDSEVVIGATYRVGTAIVQVSQPRRPCYKMAARHPEMLNAERLPITLQAMSRTGFYLRVLTPGQVEPGQCFHLLDTPAHGLTVAEVNRVMNVDRRDLDGVRRLLTARAHLPAHWVDTLTARLADRYDDDSARLEGA
ncbi:MOSC domain-containing protein [Spongiactinospora rosea]|uniref:MOSC domain-containing protein n=2 Tax=Spongiactinospora rosea TaxID=2248750 RepID=A0A366M421_9ACTN|nr:MOSC domain-containing protein [Spongiactinospora rosea]RBQ20988.1 MOSC domain-containing protein [Spongiactinospora rosea]